MSFGEGPITGTETNVNDTATDTVILAANDARRGALIVNDSTSVLYLLLANAVSSSAVFTVKLNAGDLYELPLMSGGVYRGVIKGVWSADASGAARITEFI